MKWVENKRAMSSSGPRRRVRQHTKRTSLSKLHSAIEPLEPRTLLSSASLVQVQSIARNVPAGPATSATTVSYLVTFNQPVTGVDSADFRAITTGGTQFILPITITPTSASTYLVFINGIHGSGAVQLNLVDDDSIKSATSVPLGGPGSGNGGFAGPYYAINQSYPGLISINRSAAASQSTSASSLDFTVTFSKPVVGVLVSNFALAIGEGVAVASPIALTQIDGATYTVHVTGISGSGQLGLNLSSPAGIHDVAGNPLIDLSNPVSFQPAQTFSVGAGPRAPRAADLNADGLPDVVVVNATSNTVSVMIATPGSLFGPQASYSVLSPRSVAIADLDGDGIPDLVIASDSGIASTLRGHGDGTFSLPVTYVAGPTLASVAAADFNGDGRPDLAFGQPSYNGQSHVSVLLNAGGGQFSNLQTFATGASPLSVATEDVNSDGLVDLVTANFSGGSTSILLGNGNGTFRPQKTFGLGPQTITMSVADLNGDGNIDIAALSFGGSYASILIGNGDGTFQPQHTLATEDYRGSITIADITGDGRPDLLVTSPNDAHIDVFAGRGDGTFTPQQTIATGAASADLAIADANGDGRPDLILSNGSPGTLTMLLAAPPTVYTGQTYQIQGSIASITGTQGVDHFTLTRDTDDNHIDWSFGSSTGQILINNPNGLTITGLGATDILTLDYIHGNPLPSLLHLNGIFSITGLQGTSPLAGTTLDIAQSTLYFSYSPGQSSISQIQQALTNAYTNGTWTGIPTDTAGVITSTAAASAPLNTFTIGYADSTSGAVTAQPPGTIEVKYTPVGDANLDGAVNSTDAITMARNWNLSNTSSWDKGDFNFDGTINLADATLLQKNFGVALPSIAVSLVAAATPAAVATRPTRAIAEPSDPTTDDDDRSFNSKSHSPKHVSHQTSKPVIPKPKPKANPPSEHKSR